VKKERERLSTLTHSTAWAVVSEFVMRIWLRSMPCIHSSDGSCCDVQVASLGYRRGSTVMRQRRCTANVASHTVVRPVVTDMEALPKLPAPLTREIGGPAPHCAIDLRCVLSCCKFCTSTCISDRHSCWNAWTSSPRPLAHAPWCGGQSAVDDSSSSGHGTVDDVDCSVQGC
jgi:hypothetical protein